MTNNNDDDDDDDDNNNNNNDACRCQSLGAAGFDSLAVDLHSTNTTNRLAAQRCPAVPVHYSTRANGHRGTRPMCMGAGTSPVWLVP